MKLSEVSCKPIGAGMKPLSVKDSSEIAGQIPKWQIRDNSIEREFAFKSFREAMGFVNRVAALADEQDHHPDIFISYNKVCLTLSTHKIGGLSTNDFVLAAKIDHIEGAT